MEAITKECRTIKGVRTVFVEPVKEKYIGANGKELYLGDISTGFDELVLGRVIGEDVTSNMIAKGQIIMYNRSSEFEGKFKFGSLRYVPNHLILGIYESEVELEPRLK